MKKTITAASLLLACTAFAQEHFNGAMFGQRTGLLQSTLNPAELVNLTNSWEVNLASFSAQGTSSSLKISDISGDADITSLLFSGDEPVDGRFSAVLLGPSVGFSTNGWGFALTTKFSTQMGAVNINPKVAQAVLNSDLLTTAQQLVIAPGNQRISTVAYGEVGASVAREIYSSTDRVHQLNLGATAKLYFPTMYANASLNNFQGSLFEQNGSTIITDATATATVMYAGPISESFTSDSNYLPFELNKPNGFGVDFGLNYVWNSTTDFGHLLKVGLAVRDLGSMRFSMDDASNTAYNLHINEGQNFDLSVLSGATNLRDIENYLLANGYVSRVDSPAREFDVKMSGTFTAYADVKVLRNFYISGLIKQRLSEDENNDQLYGQDLIQLTPRLSWKNIEVWSSWTENDFSGLNGGIGARFGGFIIGSGSAITALSSGKEADVYLGFQFGF